MDGPRGAGVGTAHPGFRGSTFSVMLALAPDDDGEYRTAEFLSAGGILGVTPGTYLASSTSSITSVEADGDALAMESRKTGELNNGRWYSSGVLLPDGSVLAANGADRDEVVAPGTGFPVTELELFDPATETWHPAAEQTRARTYHNTAVLLPDGRVMLGGHAPIPTGYRANQTLPGGFSENDGRDPSFGIYSPPYLFRGDRPEIIRSIGEGEVRNDGSTFHVRTDREIDEFVLVRKSAATHIVDNDQRSIVLPAERVDAGEGGFTYEMTAPPSSDMAPAGPYMLFANADSGRGLVPSVAQELMIN